jgi:hypothetical protein
LVRLSEIALFSLQQVRSSEECAVGGKAVTQVLQGEQRYDLVVRYQAPYRSSKEVIENIRLVAPSGGRVRWTYHVTMRLQQRALTAAMVRNAMATLETFESYPQDKYLPSVLLRGESEGCVFHVQIAMDVEGENIRIVTMYTPDPNEWEAGLRFRRTR